MKPNARQGLLATSVLLAVASVFVACSDDADQLEETCTMIVDKCHVGSSVGDCIDILGNETPGCIACISQAKCDYPDKCDFSTGACRLPASLLPAK